MPYEPVSILSHRVDPGGVRDLLARLVPDARVVDDGSSWLAIEMPGTGPEGNLVVLHSPESYRGDAGRDALGQVRDGCKRFPPTTRTADVMRALAAVQFRLDLGAGCVADLDRDDDRTRILLAIAGHLDGFLFSPSALRDRNGRVLIGEITPDRSALLPSGSSSMPSSELMSSRQVSVMGDTPDARRVARRALALAAVSSRAFLEQLDPETNDLFFERHRLLLWVDAAGIDTELEPGEWQVLQSKVGKLDSGRAVDAAWRFEGLTVLAWALGRVSLPPDQQLVDPKSLFPAVGFLDPAAAADFVSSAQLRPGSVIDALQDRLTLLHSKLRRFRMRKRHVELAMATKATLMRGLASSGIDGDPSAAEAGDGGALGESTPAEVQQIENMVLERLVAATWLIEGGEYSLIDVHA